MLLPYRKRYWFFTQWSFFLLWLARVVCGIRYTVEGTENVPTEPCIVMCKHQSAWETLATQYWFNPQTWVLKKELISLPMIGWALRLLNPIAIDRGARKEAVQQMLEQGVERLKGGRWIIIFPEGTRVPAGQTGRYRRGGAILSVETGTPIIPVAHNAGEMWPRNSFLKYPGEVKVRIGPPILPGDRDGEAVLAEVKHWIETNAREVSRVYQDDGDQKN
ncbi:MAG: 1-acyl-sn-glycerol-3-phosphate acyltransferase [Ectothiorhodospiraceae bacterium]|nr:1-acyl-sn-glycerol-3-phosphate acyltransferase [Ectothiorhodospiraceae bacterium]